MAHKTVIERVADLEKMVPSLLESVNDSIRRRTDPTIQTLNAVVEILGRDSVKAKMVEQMEKQQSQELEARTSHLQAGVAEGRILKVEKISENSLVVSTETDSAGKVRHPGKFHLNFGEIAPQFQEKLLGRGVGERVELPEGQGTFEVVEIYELAPTPVPAAIQTPAAN